MDVKKYLTDWAVTYYRQKDIVKKDIIAIEISDIVKIKFRDNIHYLVVEPFISESEQILNRLKLGEKVTLVTSNNIKNLYAIIKNWSKFINVSAKFNIMFVNPFSAADSKWVIFPTTHASITGKESLEKGLKALFANVDSISEEDFKKKIKN